MLPHPPLRLRVGAGPCTALPGPPPLVSPSPSGLFHPYATPAPPRRRGRMSTHRGQATGLQGTPLPLAERTTWWWLGGGQTQATHLLELCPSPRCTLALHGRFKHGRRKPLPHHECTSAHLVIYLQKPADQTGRWVSVWCLNPCSASPQQCPPIEVSPLRRWVGILDNTCSSEQVPSSVPKGSCRHSPALAASDSYLPHLRIQS